MVHLESAPALFTDSSGEMCLWVWVRPDQIPAGRNQPLRIRIPVDTITLLNLLEDSAREIRKRTLDKRLLDPG